MYTKSALVDENGSEKGIITFGPVSIAPEFQRMGYEKKLIEYSLEKAAGMGYGAVVIFGHPSNYVSMGFKSCKKYNVSAGGGAYPCAMLVRELTDGFLDGGKRVCCESTAYDFDEKDAEEYDKNFPPKKKGYKKSQEEFYIYSHSLLK